MKFKQIVFSLTVSSIVSMGFGVAAAPSLPITKTPVTPNLSFTGPTNTDSHAIMGQWFQSVATSSLEYRTHEFYDNVASYGGGEKGHLAISGYVTNVVFSFGSTAIASFDVIATVFNDCSSTNSGAWAAGTNAHDEIRSTGLAYSNTLFATILTVDFAAAEYVTLPPSLGSLGSPYRNSAPYIKAINHDYLAWYGRNSDYGQDGDFYVPGWNFGTIQPGQSSSVILSFVVQTSDGITDRIEEDNPRYPMLMDSATNGSDIFINRSTSLKIREWINDPYIDDASNYPASESTNLSNVSVFHNTVEDEGQTIAINSLHWSPNLATNYLKSVGCSGIASQVLQVCTNLITTNWVDVTTNNKAWPIPQTNYWTNINLSRPTLFYRVVQP